MGLSPGEITQLLTQIRDGNRDAEARLMPLVYDELRRLAAHYTRLERPGHSLPATALVHEAYLRLTGRKNVSWQNRAHFFGVAAQVMRHILVDHARAKLAEKRGGAARDRLSLNEAPVFTSRPSVEILALDEALGRLAKWDERQSRIVDLMFFAGLTEEETAEALGVSTRTVKRDWSVAKAWLYNELNR